MKFIKKFTSAESYNQVQESLDKPNVALILEGGVKTLKYKPRHIITPANV